MSQLTLSVFSKSPSTMYFMYVVVMEYIALCVVEFCHIFRIIF